MPEPFDRDARQRTQEALDVWLPDYVEALQQHTDLLLPALEAIEEAARWAVQITEGDGELWRWRKCEHGYLDSHQLLVVPPYRLETPCSGGSRVRVWPPEDR